MAAGKFARSKKPVHVIVDSVKKKRKRPRKRGLMANKFNQKLKYWSFLSSTTSGLGVSTVQVVRANGCHDPDSTGIGHQPRMWDQITPMYDHYYVKSSFIKVQFYIEADQHPTYVALVLKDSTTPLVSGTDYLESRNVKSGIVTAEKPLTLTMRYNTKAFLGIEPDNDKNVGIARSGNDSTDPSEQASFHALGFSLTGEGSLGFTMVYDITYDITFIEPRQPSIS